MGVSWGFTSAPRRAISLGLQREIMARTTPVEFFRQVRQEVSRVTWPTRKETMVTTAMVFAMVFAAALFFFLVDQGLAYIVRLILGLGG
jgi:preprotein translocase subunit SecE